MPGRPAGGDACTVAGGQQLIPTLPRQRTALLGNLGRIRRELGPVTPARSDALADHMGLRRGEVADVASA